jgi:hypothetical protein
MDSERDQRSGRKKWHPREQSNVPGRRGERNQGRSVDLAQIAVGRRIACEP